MSTDPGEKTETMEESDLPTAEQLLRRRAIQKPNVLALFDPPNRAALDLGAPSAFTYQEADLTADTLAAFFIELELQPGDIIAMQLPNFALSPLTLLGAWRAGLTVAALPMLWRGHEIARVCAALEPKALIGVSHFAGDTPMESLSAVAASRSQVRFVLGFGPDLPDEAGSLDEVISIPRPLQRAETLTREGPAMITFTARPGMPFVPVERDEEELLAQGAMTVLALDLDRSDVILNPYSLTGPAGLSLGFLPWLISGATLALHHPFDYGVFAEQLIATGTTVTALPSSVLAELSRDGVPQRPQCRLRRVGSVWTGDEPQDKAALDFGEAVEFFDLYSLGDLAGVVLKREAQDEPVLLPLGEIPVDMESEGAVFVETRLASLRDAEGYADILVRGPVVPRGQAEGLLVPDDNGFIATGLRGVRVGSTGMALQLKGDPELLRHGGLSIAASEFDELFRSFPAFLDAACLVLTDPPIGDHVVAAVVPRPGEPVTLEALNKFLAERRVAAYKFPDKILIVRRIPRDEHGRVLREEILLEV